MDAEDDERAGKVKIYLPGGGYRYETKVKPPIPTMASLGIFTSLPTASGFEPGIPIQPTLQPTPLQQPTFEPPGTRSINANFNEVTKLVYRKINREILKDSTETPELPISYLAAQLANTTSTVVSKSPYDWKKRWPCDPVGLRIILSKDAVSRKKKLWPLVVFEDIPQYFNDLEYSYPNNHYNGESETSKNYIPSNELFWITPNLTKADGNYRFPLDADKQSTKFNSSKPHIQLLYSRFPYLTTIFEKYKGKLAVCGGSLTRLISCSEGQRGDQTSTINDTDLFFYNTDKEEASMILAECVAGLCHAYAGANLDVRIEHKEFVTNVVISNRANEVIYTDGWGFHGFQPAICYQFVHRIYPSLESIIAGFDLGPSMLAFDGDKIYTTELGAWCLAKDTLIVDTSRLSLSFDFRVVKLRVLGYGVVFPGLTLRSKDLMGLMRRADLIEPKNLTKINKLLRKLGINFYSEHSNEDRLAHYLTYSQTAKIGDLSIFRSMRSMPTEVRIGVIDQEETSAKYIKKISDYGDVYTMAHKLDTVVSARLRCDNLESVMSYITFDQSISYDDAYAVAVDLFNNPVVQYDPTYKTIMSKYMYRWSIIPNFSPRRPAKDVSLFAEYASKIYSKAEEINDQFPYRNNVDFKNYVDGIADLMERRMEINAKLVREKLRGLSWMDQDPQRQWTSSRNPIVANPKDYYGTVYVPFRLLIPCETESTLRLIWNYRRDTIIGRLPKDIFKLLLEYIARAYLYNTTQDEYDYVLYALDRGVTVPKNKIELFAKSESAASPTPFNPNGTVQQPGFMPQFQTMPQPFQFPTLGGPTPFAIQLPQQQFVQAPFPLPPIQQVPRPFNLAELMRNASSARPRDLTATLPPVAPQPFPGWLNAGLPPPTTQPAAPQPLNVQPPIQLPPSFFAQPGIQPSQPLPSLFQATPLQAPVTPLTQYTFNQSPFANLIQSVAQLPIPNQNPTISPRSSSDSSSNASPSSPGSGVL